jgi:hypothetical protein
MNTDLKTSAVKPIRSAGWQPAVSPIGNRQTFHLRTAACELPTSDTADCQSALHGSNFADSFLSVCICVHSWLK